MTSHDYHNIPFPGSTLLRCEVGSGVHGIAQAGKNDHDEMGVCIEPFDRAFGVDHIFEQYIFRTAEIREGRKNAPSGPGDLDLTIYSLRKWTQLALKGNPTVLLLLFSPNPVWIDTRGLELRRTAPLFASKRAGRCFLGYLHTQRERLQGTRGQQNVNRKALVDLHGFDTKYASHVIRLGYQGVEYLETGALTLPLQPEIRDRCLAIRQGHVPLVEILEETQQLDHELQTLLTTSALPDLPQTDRVERWMLDQYLEAWSKDLL